MWIFLTVARRVVEVVIKGANGTIRAGKPSMKGGKRGREGEKEFVGVVALKAGSAHPFVLHLTQHFLQRATLHSYSFHHFWIEALKRPP